MSPAARGIYAGVEAVLADENAPARWDETRCLAGEPGQLAICARRASKSRFIAGITEQVIPSQFKWIYHLLKVFGIG